MTLRSKLKAHEKKYTKSAEKKTYKGPSKPLKSDSENFNRADMDLKIFTLKLKNPNDTNKPLIVSLMDETREFRRYWINTKHPTITEIFEEYPRLLDYNGERIDREFQSMYPKVADNFISLFPTSYMEKILYYVEKNRADLFLKSSFIKDSK
ncbi:hypothetical protein KQX54_014472 [Cotesia glomerata]|uniref:Uncharacterized protein n=1 Tax=Cotesia glomerata TaxID=32391 RepID=A0AAV7I9E7_COTGL|nr:hypothetical protein KQX54_014472 [Cotesia glomerata]